MKGVQWRKQMLYSSGLAIAGWSIIDQDVLNLDWIGWMNLVSLERSFWFWNNSNPSRSNKRPFPSRLFPYPPKKKMKRLFFWPPHTSKYDTVPVPLMPLPPYLNLIWPHNTPCSLKLDDIVISALLVRVAQFPSRDETNRNRWSFSEVPSPCSNLLYTYSIYKLACIAKYMCILITTFSHPSRYT